MTADHTPDRAQGDLAPRGQQVPAEMTRGEAPEDVDQTGEHRDPRKEEMQVAAGATDRDLEHEGERQVDQGGPPHGARLTPVEPGVGQQDGNAAEDQHDEAQRADPVRHPNQGGVPGMVRDDFTLHCECVR